MGEPAALLGERGDERGTYTFALDSGTTELRLMLDFRSVSELKHAQPRLVYGRGMPFSIVL